MAMTDLEWVRSKSTSSTTALPDDQITDFLGEYSTETTAHKRKLALADCLEYLARDDVYASYSRGGISVGQNQLYARAQALRAEVGVTIETGTLQHAMYSDDDGDYA